MTADVGDPIPIHHILPSNVSIVATLIALIAVHQLAIVFANAAATPQATPPEQFLALVFFLFTSKAVDWLYRLLTGTGGIGRVVRDSQ